MKKIISKVKNFNSLKFWLAVAFIVIAIVLRFMPHLPNFAPIAAMALFGGVYLNKKYALIFPLAAIAISDYFIGFYDFKLMASVYFCFILAGLIGLFLKKNKSFIGIVGGTFFASILFFIITNFAVWAFYSWYPHNLTGLFQCFISAVPFFRNTLLGNFFYVAVLFGVYELIILAAKKKFFATETYNWDKISK